MSELELNLEYLGYKVPISKLNVGNGYNQLFRIISALKMSDLGSLKPITLEEVKKEAVEFYKKYFDLHDIKHVSEEEHQSILKDVSSGKLESLEAYRMYYQLLKEISPFNVPIKLIEEESIYGKLKLPLLLMYKEDIPSDVGVMVPFSEIELGNQLTKISSSTYIHEIAHMEQETNPGYAENYLNKEVISIFLEKISALENDPSGNLLKTIERRRFMLLSDDIRKLFLEGKFIKLSDEDRLNTMTYVQSTLLAEKLFDMYLKERKQKEKDKYIRDIQNVFDGRQTVDDMIGRRGVTLNQCLDTSLIKRHI